MIAYQFTFTKRFQKHFKNLTAQEKKQFQNKLQLLAENPMHPSSVRNAFREPEIYLSAASTWTSVLSGTMRAIRSLFLLMSDTMTF